MSELSIPQNWVLTTLGSILSVSSGKGLPQSKMVEGNIPVYGGNGVTGQHNTHSIEQVTIVIGREGFYCGSVHLTPSKSWVTDNAFITKYSDSNIDQMFLYWLLKSTDLRKNDSSTAQPVISGKKLYPTDVLLPPLAEQEEIARRLDDLLSQVDSIKTRLDKVPGTLKTFRQSVLAAAVSGQLTESWRKENTPIKINETNNTYSLSEEFDYYEIPDTWSFTPIGNIAAFQQGMQIAKSSRHEADGPNRLPILRIGNYSSQFTKDVDYIDVDSSSLIAEKDDIILTRTGESRGGVLTGYRGVFHNNTFRINFNESAILREYLIISLKNEQTQNFIKEVSGRSAQPDLTHKKFGPCPISLPSLEEQAEIVRRVEELFAYADKVEAQVKVAQERVNKLTQSILAKAFRGELTEAWRATNPELITGPNSAAALLARIQAEREAAQPKKKPRKKKA
ncbi:restriction endonuclease subunit S [Lentisphaera profundi]|uniref:Restriction endonuclease subunit S n=1 Tax=Lentisphaera profundi TaxID=1658616 RepID=A0ABY7VMX4_9BACT|nr:restriction endonuclease subunit S [Lentisphaera profundi]WDE95406.1 restriction endonuclease subunit S [Lentisphaera profundi]